jgi:hypothetical protein
METVRIVLVVTVGTFDHVDIKVYRFRNQREYGDDPWTNIGKTTTR